MTADTSAKTPRHAADRDPAHASATRSGPARRAAARRALRTALLWLTFACSALPALLPVARAAGEFLEPEAAFRTEVVRAEAREIVVRARAAQGYYLYRERFSVDSWDNGVQLGAPILPPGDPKYDPNFGRQVETYRGEVLLRVPVIDAPARFTVRLGLQGCADAGLCYSPMQVELPVALAHGVGSGGTGTGPAAQNTPLADGRFSGADQRPATGGANALRVAAATTAVAGAQAAESDLSRIQRTLASGRVATVAPAFFLLGLLLALTPCVLPMVPILASIVVGEGEPPTRSRGFALALAYSLGMAIVYTGIGVAAGLAGEGLAAWLQKPWVLALFASMLVALALSMFDVYQIEMPRFVQARATSLASRLPGGRFAGVFAMGAASALIVGPCVAAPLAGALVYISQTRDVVLGGAALFSLAMGMSVPLLAIGASAGSLLPRSGMWMVAVKRFFGVLLIGVAIWLPSPALPEWAQMLAWASLFVVSAAYLSVFDPLPAGASGWRRLWKGIGVLLLLLGTVQIVGVASGGRKLLQPLEAMAARTAAGAARSAEEPRFERVRGIAELERRLASAGRPVLVDVSAAWCVSCREMEAITFADPRVAERMRRLVLLKVDVTDNDAEDRAVLKRFGLFGPPGVLLFGSDGRERVEARAVGFVPPERFLEHLAHAG